MMHVQCLVQSLLAHMSAMLEHVLDNPDAYMDADVETCARRVRNLIRAKLQELTSVMGAALKSYGSSSSGTHSGLPASVSCGHSAYAVLLTGCCVRAN